MTQPFHGITLAIQQQRPFNSALDYSAQSRTMPVYSMNNTSPPPLQFSTPTYTVYSPQTNATKW